MRHIYRILLPSDCFTEKLLEVIRRCDIVSVLSFLFMSYVDGFVLVVPKKNLKAYRKMAAEGAKIWRKHGALDYKECVGDDMQPNMGGVKGLTFPKMAKTKPSDVVVFSFIVYKSRKHRDAVNAKVMKDPAMNEEVWKDKPMPFDMKRMAYGGFEVMVG